MGAAIVSVLIFGTLSILQIGFHKQIGNHPAPNGLLLFFFAGGVAATVLIYFQKLKVLITEREIRISFGLLTSKVLISKASIKGMQIRKYNAIKEFTGWGIRYNGNQSCFTVSGSDALEIILNTNQIVLIGTQVPKKMQPVVDDYLNT